VPDGSAFAFELCTVNTREYVLPRLDGKGYDRKLSYPAFAGGTQVYRNSEDSLCPARDPNQEPPKYKYRVMSGFRPEVDENCDLLGSEEYISLKYRVLSLVAILVIINLVTDLSLS